MKFRTSLSLVNKNSSINYSSKLALIGSCFSLNIGTKLQDLKHDCLVNPFGILFHPFAILESLKQIHAQKKYNSSDLFFHDNLYKSWNHHSSFNSENSEEILRAINTQIKFAYHFLTQADYLFITLGTAWVYDYQGKTVANCHKVHPKDFKKRLLSFEEIKASLEEIKTICKLLNPNLKVVYTLSPIRHIKDGIVENQLSKSLLRSAIGMDPMYFPSYEFLMDDLRDYRFYESDMIHPSKMAIEYIWEQFCTYFFQDETLSLHKKIAKINQGLNHRGFQVESPAHQIFLKKLQNKIGLLPDAIRLKFQDDLLQIEKQLLP